MSRGYILQFEDLKLCYQLQYIPIFRRRHSSQISDKPSMVYSLNPLEPHIEKQKVFVVITKPLTLELRWERSSDNSFHAISYGCQLSSFVNLVVNFGRNFLPCSSSRLPIWAAGVA